MKENLDSKIPEKRTALREKIRSWEDVRGIYMPSLRKYVSETMGGEEDTLPEEIKLWLPSALTPSLAAVTCAPGLTEIEDKFRTAHCYDALESLRHILRVKTRMVLFKNKNIRGQREGLRSTAVIVRRLVAWLKNIAGPVQPNWHWLRRGGGVKY